MLLSTVECYLVSSVERYLVSTVECSLVSSAECYLPSTMSRVTLAEGGTASWLLCAMQEMTVLASSGCSLAIISTLLTSEPTLTVCSDNRQVVV